MRYAFNVFEPYRTARKAAIFGSARTKRDDPLYEQTVSLANELAAADWMVITGAGPGIMEAGIEGAGANNSFGVSIRLPFDESCCPCQFPSCPGNCQHKAPAGWALPPVTPIVAEPVIEEIPVPAPVIEEVPEQVVGNG